MSATIHLPEIVDAATIAELLEKHEPVKILDVRTPAEFESVHIPGSYNVPLDLLSEHREELESTLRSPAVLVCRSGNRAEQAANLLRQTNLSNVHILEGGITAWQSSGKPINRGQQRWSLERQVRGVAGTLVLAGVIGGLLFRKPVSLLAGGVGAGLTISALTDTCTMARLLMKLPYNRGATCDMSAVVERLAAAESQ
jgi:rhodanese-related sulfurtransferase